MGLISLEGMRFYAYHGFYEEERIMGNDYMVDVHIKANFSKASKTDDLYSTINYETVYLICKNEMAKPRKLLEAIAQSILNKLKMQFGNMQTVNIRITKINPPLGGRVASASVQVDGSFTSKCGRCGSGIACYKDGSCWCNKIKIHPETQGTLEQQYAGCLCQNCLGFFADK